MTTRHIAIIGTGPRGLVALEALIAELANNTTSGDFHIALFEASEYPGCGPNYAPDQPHTNQLNMPFREVPMRERHAVRGKLSYPAFPAFQKWYHDRHEISDSAEDLFPPRAQIGEYLQARFQSIIEQSGNTPYLTLQLTTVVAVDPYAARWSITTTPALQLNRYDEVLLTIGHQDAEITATLDRWRKHGSVFLEPYPTAPLITASSIDTQSVVALRGMGLSMIDVVKALTSGRDGRFDVHDTSRLNMTYHASGREPSLMMPFSLDGQPLAPKPLNATLDERFRPDDDDIDSIEKQLQFDNGLPRDDELRMLLVDAVSSIAPSIYLSLQTESATAEAVAPDLPDIDIIWDAAKRWLLDETVTHPTIVAADAPTAFIMQQFLDMATGHRPPSLDYCLGQIWRHLQPTFYTSLRFKGIHGETIQSAMALDQRMKRYAFGPPAAAVARLLALNDCGLLKFELADDPDVKMVESGWRLRDEEDSVIATVIINTVLDPPKLNAISSPLVTHLRERALVEMIHDELGAQAQCNGQLITHSTTPGTLAGAGRLIIGSVVEADALIACFGNELEDWASGVVDRQCGASATL